MPLYSDGNFYYSGGSSQLYSPYYSSGLYSTPSTGAYTPYTSTYNRTISGSYVVPLSPSRTPSSYSTATHGLSTRYQPKLMTITETSPLISSRHGLMPLTRIQSPKYTSYSTPTSSASSLFPKYIAPRPIPINTADIDVSASKYRKHSERDTLEDAKKKRKEETGESIKTPSQTPSPSGSTKKRGSNEKPKNKTEADEDEQRTARSTIRRNRPVVRLSTIRSRSKDRAGGAKKSPTQSENIFRDLPHPPAETSTESVSWRQKLADDLAAIPAYPIKKSPGDLIRERYLIQDSKTETIAKPNKTAEKEEVPAPQKIEQVVVELDALHHTIRRLSLPKCPTFHDICEDISSDKIDDDLNAGELRRRASLIQEQEQEILNQLQKSASGTFQLIHLERRSSQDSLPDESTNLGTKRKSRKSKKIRHKITAIVEVDNPSNVPLMPILVEKDEDPVTPSQRPSPKFTFNVESVDEHDEVHKIFKLPKKKSVKKTSKPKDVKLPEGFVAAPPKAKKTMAASVSEEKSKTYVSTAEIFTFSQQSIDKAEGIKETVTSEAKDIKRKLEKHTVKNSLASKAVKAEVNAVRESELKNAVLSTAAVTKELTIKIETPSKSSIPVDQAAKKPMNAVLSTIEKASTPPAKDQADKPSLDKDKNLLSNKSQQTAIKSSISLDNSSVTPPTSSLKPFEKTLSLSAEDQQPKVATPKPIRKAVEKSDSGIDFWSQIGSRETIYMANRKKSLHEIQWEKVEEDEVQTNEPPTNQNQHVSDKEISEAKKTTPKTVKKITPKKQSPVKKMNTSSTDESKDQIKSKILKVNVENSQSTVAKITETSTATKIETIATANLATATNTTTPKINAGQVAKSPERQKDSKTDAVAVAATTTTTEQSASTKQDKTLINNVETSAKTTVGQFTVAKTASTELTTSATKLNKTPIDAPATQKQTLPEVNVAKLNKLTEDKLSEKKCTIDPKSPIAIDSGEKSKLTLEKKNAAGKAKVSPPSNAQTTASTPINADHFITLPAAAAAKANTTTTAAATTTSPKSPLNKDKTSSSPAKVAATKEAKKTTAIATKVPAPTKTIATTTIIATPTIATTTTTSTSATAIATATATIPIAAKIVDEHDSAACATSESGSNLSKFATVSNLAQCLQDVNADLEDYIPSSAEEDDSLSDISLPDGCENLSNSMKKKLKQKKKKERQAEKPQFDPQKKIKIEVTNKCYVKEEAPRYPLIATPRPLWRREKVEYPDEDTESESDDSDSGSTAETTDDSEECSTSEEYEDDLATSSGAASGVKDNSSIIRMSTCSNDSGFEGGTAPSSPKKMLECDVNCHKKCERLTANLCGVNQKLIVEALAHVKRGAREARESPSTPPSLNPAYKIDGNVEEEDETSCTYTEFQKSGRFTAPATVIPRFKNYCVDDFHFLAVLGKGSFGKVLLAELRDTTYYYAVKCLKKDVVLEDDDVDSTLIERKVLALGTKHPYLCHLFCTFQTESHLFFVMEYLNGGDLMFHIQESGRFTEERARFYGAEIISGLKFLHKKGIIYRDLKLDNVLLDYEGHVRIADFGMCKLQIYLDKTADSFCGTPDYMAPEIVKGEKYNQNVDWWSFGVLLYEMLIGQSPFSGCDEDELFWSICNEIPWFPVYISAEAMSILKGLLEKDYMKRIGSQYSPAGDVSEHIFFRPIDWNLLEKRQLVPPFRPQVKHPLDTQYFDRVFTRERVRLTPIDKDILQSMDQKQFLGFTYTNPHITLD